MAGRFYVAIISLFFSFFALACSGDEEKPKGAKGSGPTTTLDYELFETTKELDAATLDALESVSDDLTSITFAESTPLLDDLQPNDVILAGPSEATPRGLIVLVSSVEPDGAAW